MQLSSTTRTMCPGKEVAYSQIAPCGAQLYKSTCAAPLVPHGPNTRSIVCEPGLPAAIAAGEMKLGERGFARLPSLHKYAWAGHLPPRPDTSRLPPTRTTHVMGRGKLRLMRSDPAAGTGVGQRARSALGATYAKGAGPSRSQCRILARQNPDGLHAKALLISRKIFAPKFVRRRHKMCFFLIFLHKRNRSHSDSGSLIKIVAPRSLFCRRTDALCICCDNVRTEDAIPLATQTHPRLLQK